MTIRCENCTADAKAYCDAMFGVARQCIEDGSDIVIDFDKGSTFPGLTEGLVDNFAHERERLKTTLTNSLRELNDCLLTEVEIDQRLSEVEQR